MRSLEFTIYLLLSTFLIVDAQSLPNKQEVSVWAPVNLKIDGKATEWGDVLKAYNHATEIYYTIANNDKNIYIVLKATNLRIITKIIEAGQTFVIKNDTDKKKNVEITYPVIDIPIGVNVILNAGGKTTVRPFMGTPDSLVKATPTSNDSLKSLASKQLTEAAKTIRVKGLSKGEPVEEISVYNEQGITVSASFDNSGAYNYEMAIPIKYFPSAIVTGHLKYMIRLESRLDQGKHFMTYYKNGVDLDADLDTATDFSGEYTLAKKP